MDIASSVPNTVASAAPAHLGWRLAALVYDFLPLLALGFLAAALALALTAGTLDVHKIGDKLLVQGLVVLLSAAYFVTSWLRGGQTIGMRAWRLRVVRSDGQALNFRQTWVRFLVAWISLAALGLGFFWCLIDRERRAWHDIAAGTLLVRLHK